MMIISIGIRGETIKAVGERLRQGYRAGEAKLVKLFFTQHAERLTLSQRPCYSPDYIPIECLWRATQHPYFPEFEELVASVECALADWARPNGSVRSLFTFYWQRMAHPPADVLLPTPGYFLKCYRTNQ